MRSLSKLIIWGKFIIVYLVAISSIVQAEPIEPTQTLKGKPEAAGRLTVLSEPPGLKISLDGNSLGKTPAFLIAVEPGMHTLQVRNSKTDIFIESGKLLKISLFKNEFVLIPVKEKTVETESEKKAGIETQETQVTRPKDPIQNRAEANREEASDRWQQYIDGTRRSF